MSESVRRGKQFNLTVVSIEFGSPQHEEESRDGVTTEGQSETILQQPEPETTLQQPGTKHHISAARRCRGGQLLEAIAKWLDRSIIHTW